MGMTDTKCKRSNTRKIFKIKKSRKNHRKFSILSKLYKKNDKINIIIDPSAKKGIPNKFFTGKSGVIRETFGENLLISMIKTTKNKKLSKKLYLDKSHVNLSKKNLNKVLFPKKDFLRTNESMIMHTFSV